MNLKNSFRKTFFAAGIAASVGLSGIAVADSATVGAAITDTAITAKVKAKYADDARVKATDISVTTNNGVVTLTGSAPSSDAKTAAETIAKSVEGVTSVDDEITSPSVVDQVASSTKHAARTTATATTDTWVTTKVKSKLLANSLTKGIDVKVTTTDGIVALSGTAPTDAAKTQAVKIAKATKHVKSVDASALTVTAS